MHIIGHLARSVFASIALFLLATPVHAVDPPAPTAAETGLKNPLGKIADLPAFMNAILDAVVNLGTILLVLALVYIGFQFVVAQGNEEKLKSARSALMWTVIGGLVLLGAKTLGLVIQGTVESLK